MTSAAQLAVFGAIGIALLSACFGVGVARLLWAEDLAQAQRIDAIRSRTEVHLRNLIALHEKQIAEYRQRLGEDK